MYFSRTRAELAHAELLMLVALLLIIVTAGDAAGLSWVPWNAMHNYVCKLKMSATMMSGVWVHSYK